MTSTKTSQYVNRFGQVRTLPKGSLEVPELVETVFRNFDGQIRVDTQCFPERRHNQQTHSLRHFPNAENFAAPVYARIPSLWRAWGRFCELVVFRAAAVYAIQDYTRSRMRETDILQRILSPTPIEEDQSAS